MWIFLTILSVAVLIIANVDIDSKIKGIVNAKSSEEAIEERKSLKRKLKYYPILGLFTGRIPLNYQETLDQVSDETIDTFLSRPRRFALYLRAFHNDRYSSHSVVDHFVSMDLAEDDSEDGSFSEKVFADEMEKSINTYAVGMSKEVVHPDGARRIYLNDDTWQEDVLELMEAALQIIVLVENRESCIWELQQSMAMLEKVYFIVDDVKMYLEIKEELPLTLPSIPSCMLLSDHFIFHWQDGRCVMLPFLNTKDDYAYLACSINNSGLLGIKEEMSKGIYDGLGRLWVDVSNAEGSIQEQMNQLVQLKQQVCPMAIFDTMTMLDCGLVDHCLEFQIQVDELDVEENKALFEVFSFELSLMKNKFFVSILKCLKLDICHKISCPNSLQQVEILIHSAEL